MSKFLITVLLIALALPSFAQQPMLLSFSWWIAASTEAKTIGADATIPASVTIGLDAMILDAAGSSLHVDIIFFDTAGIPIMSEGFPNPFNGQSCFIQRGDTTIFMEQVFILAVTPSQIKTAQIFVRKVE